jgi:hypothetical protein
MCHFLAGQYDAKTDSIQARLVSATFYSVLFVKHGSLLDALALANESNTLQTAAAELHIDKLDL